MIPLSIWMAATAAVNMPCRAVAGDRITGADLAALLPEFAEVAPQAIIGYSPQPGAYRTFEPAELTRFAAANGLQYRGLATICFEPALEELEPARIQASIRESLKGILSTVALAGADVEVIEYSNFRVPSGKLSFPIDALPVYASSNSAIWNGFVEHENKRYPVWARVRILAAQTRVVAAAELRAGRPIEAADVRLEEARIFPVRAAALQSVSDCAGKLARRYLAAGTPVSPGDLMEPYDVERGEVVRVAVQSGGAMLTLEAEAQATGRRGETIALRNAASGKIFRAKITGKGRALLDCPASEGEQTGVQQ